jgi:hypothetical protein
MGALWGKTVQEQMAEVVKDCQRRRREHERAAETLEMDRVMLELEYEDAINKGQKETAMAKKQSIFRKQQQVNTENRVAAVFTMAETAARSAASQVQLDAIVVKLGDVLDAANRGTSLKRIQNALAGIGKDMSVLKTKSDVFNSAMDTIADDIDEQNDDAGMVDEVPVEDVAERARACVEEDLLKARKAALDRPRQPAQRRKKAGEALSDPSALK